MEELLFEWLFANAEYAPFLIFGLLVIAGFSLPISEDLLVILSGVLASTVIPEYTAALFFAAFFGSYLSDGIAYWLGRSWGPKVYSLKWCSFANKEKIETFYQKYGVWALVVGRCIPFGLRNAIFMTAGAGRMPFGKFLLCDGFACLFFSAAVFALAYACGKNYEVLRFYLYQVGIGVLLVCMGAAVWLWFKRPSGAVRNKVPNNPV